MNKLKITLICGFVILLFQLYFASALIATIDNPKMVVYKNITSGEKLVFENSVTVINENNNSILISVAPDKNLKPYVTVIEPNFTMEAGERKEVFYKVTIKTAGEYGGDLIVTFQDPNLGTHLSLAQRFVVQAKQVNSKNSNLKPYLYVLGALIVIFLILIIIKNKSFKKNRK